MPGTLTAVVILLLPVSLSAQWLNYRTPGIPRTADGKPNLTAPAPRSPDGKPDLSGLWRVATNFYWLDLIADIKDEAIFKPAAAALFRKRSGEYNLDGPYTRCLPLGPGDIFVHAFRLLQSATVVALLYNGVVDGYRQIFLDGRELPKDPSPTWRGYSVARWEGETMVVETAGFNDQGWLDQVGHPRSESLRVTERLRRIDFGHMQFQITFDDPETLVKPLTISLPVNYMPDTEMLEYVCNENERDRAHFTGNLNDRVKLSADALQRYAGTYGPLVVRLVEDRLFVADIPLFPQSDTRFDWRLAPLEFTLDPGGAVKSLTLIGALGDEFRFDKR